MKTIRLQLETLTCPSCINRIESVLGRESGVENVKVMFNSSKVKIDYQSDKTNSDKLSEVLNKLGYPVIS